MPDLQPPKRPSSDVVFSDSVKSVQEELGSRAMMAEREAKGGFHETITPELAEFIGTITTCYLASASAAGQPSVQHRGGPPGFLQVLDEHTVGFADFVGNRQYVTLGNLRENPRVALILMDYESRRRVKIWGEARAVGDDTELLARLFPAGYRALAKQAILITVAAWDINCSQHIPEMFHAARVAATIMQLQSKIGLLEREIDELKLKKS